MGLNYWKHSRESLGASLVLFSMHSLSTPLGLSKLIDVLFTFMNLIYRNSFTSMIPTDPGYCTPSKISGNLSCTGAFNLLKNNLVDVHIYPFPIDSISPYTPIVDVVDTAFETIQAVGSLFSQSVTNGQNAENRNDFTTTVDVDGLVYILISLLIFITWTGLCLSIYNPKTKKDIKRHRRQRSSPNIPVSTYTNILWRLLEGVMKHPNLECKILRTMTMRRFFTSNLLFFFMFIFIVYCNMFGSNLTIDDPISRIDSLDAVTKLNLSIVPESSGVLQQLIRSLPASRIDTPEIRILELIKSRMHYCYNSQKQNVCNKTRLSQDVYRRRAVFIQSLYYHKIVERTYCVPDYDYFGITYPGGDMNRYHISKEKFLPLLLVYIGSKETNAEVRRRFKFAFTVVREYGLENAHQRIVPGLVTQFRAKDSKEQTDVEHCLRNRFLDHANDHQTPEQSDVSVASILIAAQIFARFLILSILSLATEIIYFNIFAKG